MSVWTHVCGLIYIDDMNLDKNTATKFGRKLERVYKAEAPVGSEGKLTIKAVRGKECGWNSSEGILSYQWALSIFGGLRDYTDVKYIKSWLDKVAGGVLKAWFIRDGIVQIKCENGTEFVWQYKSKV